MDSDEEEDQMDQRDEFAKQGGEALDLDGDFQDSEDVDEEEEDNDPSEMMRAAQKKDGSGGKPGKEVKGEKLEN